MGHSHTDYTQSELENQAAHSNLNLSSYAPKPLHGADVQIEAQLDYYTGGPYYKGLGTSIRHLDKSGVRSTPKVVSHKQGIRVGCTFVTNDALDELYKIHKNFLKTGDSKIHQ